MFSWLGASAICIATLIAYLPALNAGYIWDDDDYVTENELLAGMEGLRYIWLPDSTWTGCNANTAATNPAPITAPGKFSLTRMRQSKNALAICSSTLIR